MTTDLIMSDQIDWKARVERLQRFVSGESGYAVYPGGIFMTDGPSPFYDDLRALLSRITELEAEPDWKARALKAEGERDAAVRYAAALEETLEAVMDGVQERTGRRGMSEGFMLPVTGPGSYQAIEAVLEHPEEVTRAYRALAAALQSKLTRLVEACRKILAADREALADHRPKWGIADCVDNTGKPYQSQWLADALRTLSEALEGGEPRLPPSKPLRSKMNSSSSAKSNRLGGSRL